MKKSFLSSLFIILGVLFLEPSISKEIVEDKNLIEKVSFDIGGKINIMNPLLP